ncbi:MAG: ABC transporter substrate-binding protein [Vicinamibacteria bacterium]
MKNRSLASPLALWLLGACTASAADIAVLKSTDAPAWRPALDALRRSVPNHTVTEYDLKNERAEADRILGTLKGKGAILVALGPLAAQAARETLPESPLVFGMVQDPAKAGLAVAQGVTGVGFAIPVKNQLAAFRLVNPRGVRIGVIFNEANTGRLVQEARTAASVVRLVLVERPVAADKDVPEALRSLLKGSDSIDALWIPPDPVLLADEARRYILSETLKAGKPVYSFSAALVSEGALVSDGPDVASTGEQLAELVNRLAAGEKGKIEMMIPKGELVVNKKMADKLKLEIPSDALRAASKVL